MSRMRRVWNLFSTLAAMAILGVVMAPQPPLNAQGKGGGKTAPKNLKVLTPENLMAQMQTFPVALGVENQGGCNFCHEADRSLDTKPTKVKAREMIEMLADINAKFGDQRVPRHLLDLSSRLNQAGDCQNAQIALRRRRRRGAAAVAGVASHVLLSVRECAVDCAHHDDHSARGHLLGLLVGGPIVDVAVVARSPIQKAQPLHE